MNQRIEKLLKRHVEQKTSYSINFPYLRGIFVFLRRLDRKYKNKSLNISRNKWEYKKYINVRHQSVLMRKLWNVDMKLQENKTQNILLANHKLDSIIINPWEIFSFWELVWKPTYKKWYLDWVLINHGWVATWVGWGLCQLSNLLYWMFLHLDVEILERHRHSYDIFPDSGRVLPFASWATVFYNYVDLKVKNTLDYPIQIKLWTNDKYLKWQLLSDFPRKEKFHVYEKFHTFIKAAWKYFRYNLIHREKIVEWKIISDEKVLENFSPVMYEVDEDRLMENWYELIKTQKWK
jgi:vancomycin resistance protein VanW